MAGNLTRINNNQITDAVSGNTQFGINANTKIQGGEIVLKNGKPTGLLIDNAMLAVERCVPELPDSVFSYPLYPK